MKNKVNLFIIGASKCGTTSLWHMLNNHPEVFMSTPKEPRFFSFSNYLKRIEWYESLFENVSNETIIGEATPTYSETTLIPEIPLRIHQYNPNAKIIYIVREPISRLKSVWRQTLSTGHWYKHVYKNYTDTMVPLMPKKIEDAIFQYPPFIEACKYWTHLNNFRNYFDDQNILLLFFEDLKSDPAKVYYEMCRFLGITSQADKTIYEKKNTSEGKTMDLSWVAYLKRSNVLQIIAQSLKKFGLKITMPRESINYEIKINHSAQNEINNILKIEKKNILSFGNKPLNFWDYK